MSQFKIARIYFLTIVFFFDFHQVRKRAYPDFVASASTANRHSLLSIAAIAASAKIVKSPSNRRLAPYAIAVIHRSWKSLMFDLYFLSFELKFDICQIHLTYITAMFPSICLCVCTLKYIWNKWFNTHGRRRDESYVYVLYSTTYFRNKIILLPKLNSFLISS